MCVLGVCVRVLVHTRARVYVCVCVSVCDRVPRMRICPNPCMIPVATLKSFSLSSFSRQAMLDASLSRSRQPRGGLDPGHVCRAWCQLRPQRRVRLVSTANKHASTHAPRVPTCSLSVDDPCVSWASMSRLSRATWRPASVIRGGACRLSGTIGLTARSTRASAVGASSTSATPAAPRHAGRSVPAPCTLRATARAAPSPFTGVSIFHDYNLFYPCLRYR